MSQFSSNLLLPAARRFAVVVCAILTALVLFSSPAVAADTDDVNLAPGVVISVEPGTVFRKLAPRTLTLLRGKKVVTQVLSLQEGQIQATVQGSGAVMILTYPSVSAICIDGQMLIARKDAKTMVANVAGTTALAGPKRLSTLSPGKVRTWTTGGMTDSALPPAPTFVPTRSLWIDVGDGAKLSDLSWPIATGASGYELEVSESGAVVASIRTVEPTLRDANLTLRQGRYALRLRAHDVHGLAGKPSPAVPVRVVGLALPPGAHVDHAGTVRLGEGQRLSFREADDVAVTVGRDGRFKSVHGDVGLEDSEGTTAWFRLKDSPRPEAWVRIEPRQVDADVTFRRGAGWPEDALFISVRVKGANGRPAPAWLQPTSRVTLGVQPLEVAWKTVGDTMFAELSARPKTPGPWVVRVHVEDQYGVPIANDFLELMNER